MSPSVHLSTFKKVILFASLMLGLAIATTMAVVWVVQSDARQARDALQQQQATVVQMQGLVIDRMIATQVHGLLYLSRKRNVRGLAAGDMAQLQEVEDDFGAFLDEQLDYQSITLIDTDQHRAVAFDRSPTGASTRALPYSTAALAPYHVRESLAGRAGQVWISPLAPLSGTLPASTMRLVTPLVDDSGQVHGVIAVDFSAQRLWQQLGKLNLALAGRLYLLNQAGQILFVSGHPPSSATGTAAPGKLDPDLAAWARRHGSVQAMRHGALLTQVMLCATTSGCQHDDATRTAFLPSDQPWRLLRVITAGQGGYDPSLLGGRDRPFMIIYLALLALLLTGALFGAKLFSTMRKLQRNQRQLRQSGALIEAFVNNNPIAIFIRDRTGRYLYVNRAQAARFGLQPSDLLGRKSDSLLADDEIATVRAEDDEVVRRATAVEFMHQLRLPAGDRHYTSFKFPLTDPDTGQLNIAAIETDISERIKAEGDAEHHAAMLSAIFDAAPDGIVFLDQQGCVESANASALRLFGYTKDEMASVTIDALVAEPVREGFLGKLQALFEPNQVTTEAVSQLQVLDGLRKDGHTFPLEMSVGLASVSNHRFVGCMVRDISQRKQVEAQLQRSQKMEAIGQLTGGMAHDFNNLLGVILGNLDLLERALGENEAALKRVYAARRAAERGADLNVRLLAFSRRQSLKPQSHDVNALLIELLAMLPQTLGPDLRLVHKLAGNLPSVLIDASGFESALLNLAINARDAMPYGGTLTFSSRLIELGDHHVAVIGDEVPAGSYVLVSVSDTGQGIDKEILGRVFEPFFSTKPRGKGTGLGLAMVYGFIKQSKGHTTIYSEVGKGTTINLHLPVDERTASDSQSDAAIADQSGELAPRVRMTAAARDCTILVVDDELGLLEVTSLFLREQGYQVLDAADGQSALDIARDEKRIDLLLTDIVMPGYMNGVELAKAVRVLHPSIRMLYMSGFPSSGLTLRTGLPVDEPVLNKPFSRKALVDAVQRQMGGDTSA